MTRRSRCFRTLAALAAIPAGLLASEPASGQSRADRWLADCRQDGRQDRRETHCEVRSYQLAPTGSLEVDAQPNGGISIVGWDREEVQVVAMVRAHSTTMEEAHTLARDLEVIAEPGRIRTDGPRPERGTGWSVSYEIRVPRQTNLDLESSNGGLDVQDVTGDMRLRTTNGGIELAGVSGDVQGRTVNGGVTVELDGDRWTGRGLELQTTNGGVTLRMPPDYSAELSARTVNGRLEVDFPITVQGRLGKQVEASLGNGGAPIRVQTTNGGISLRRR